MKKSLIFVFLILSAFCIVTIFCKANYIIAKFTDICTYDNSQDIILVGHDSRKITSVDYIESKSNTGDLNAFEGIGALFSGLAFLAAFYTLTQQSKNIELAEESNKNNLRYQEFNSIFNSIALLQQTLYQLNEVYRSRPENVEYDDRDRNLAGCFSTKIYHDIAKNYEDFKASHINDINEYNAEVLKNWLQNQLHYHTQPFAQIIYTVRAIFSRIDNSDFIGCREKSSLKDYLFFSLSHTDYKVLQLVYLRKSMWTDYGRNDYFSQVFSDKMGALIVKQLTDIDSAIADDFILNALKDAEHNFPSL